MPHSAAPGAPGDSAGESAVGLGTSQAAHPAAQTPPAPGPNGAGAGATADGNGITCPALAVALGVVVLDKLADDGAEMVLA